MPNWTENRVTVRGNPQSIDEFKQFVFEDKDRPFSLDRILPMPKAMEIESGSMVSNALKVMRNQEKWMTELTPRARHHTRRAIANMAIFGAKDWYEWSNRFWGTKWDTCECKLVSEQKWDFNREGVREQGKTLIYEFLTAWDAPREITPVLRAMFPELEIEWKAVNEEDAYIRNEQQSDESACDAWVRPDLDEHPNAYEI